MNQKWAGLAAIVLLVVVPVVVSAFRPNDAKEVEVERVEPRAVAPSILASGVLTYGSQATLVSEVVGRVEAVLVKEGDPVSKGQLLLRLDGESSRAEIAQLQASLRQAKLNAARQRITRDAAHDKRLRYEELRRLGMIELTRYDEFVTQQRVAEVEARASDEAVLQAEAQLQQSRQRMQKTEIRSPIDGKVTSMSIKLGETAVPSAVNIAGSTLMVVSDTRSTFAEINVDEADISQIAIGQEAKVVPATFKGRALRGKVDQVATVPRQTSGQSRSYAVRVRLEPGEPDFRPGMSCRAEIAIGAGGGAKSLSVPVQAVQYLEGDGGADKARAAVFVVDAGKVVRRHVETGVADDSYVEIREGVLVGQTVITGPAKTLRFLRDGDSVRARPRAQASTAPAPNPL